MRIKYLRSILQRAVNPDGLKETMSDMGIERSIFNTEAEAAAAYFGFRVAVVRGFAYILCPVHFLYDEERQIEAGFAIDVDQDHFTVYAFMYNQQSKQYLVLSQLPHCVLRAIMLDGTDYSHVSDEIKESSNEFSAVFFINSLIVDLDTETGAPVEFFDDKLYLQLLNRFVQIKDPGWISNVAICKKFDQIMRLYTMLDESDPMYQNNRLRIFTNFAQFVFGISDVVNGHNFAMCLDRADIKRHEITLQLLLESIDFWKFLLDFKGPTHSQLLLPLDIAERGGFTLSDEFTWSFFKNFHNVIPDFCKASRWNPENLAKIVMESNAQTDDASIQALFLELLKRCNAKIVKILAQFLDKEPSKKTISMAFNYLSRNGTLAQTKLDILQELMTWLSDQGTIDWVSAMHLDLEHHVLLFRDGSKRFIVKIITAGDGGTGKTTMVHRYISDRFVADTSLTIGVQFFAQHGTFGGVDYSSAIWDFAGQDRWTDAQKFYVPGAKGAILAFDLTRMQTTFALESRWLQLLRREDPGLPIILVGLKKDMVDPNFPAMEPNFGRDFVATHGLQGYVEASCRTGEGIEESFKMLIKAIFDHNSIPYDPNVI